MPPWRNSIARVFPPPPSADGHATVQVASRFGTLHLTRQVFAPVGDKPVAADPHFQLFSTLLSEAIAAIRIGDARGAARFAQQCLATGASLGLDALFEHMDAAIARRQAERSE